MNSQSVFHRAKEMANGARLSSRELQNRVGMENGLLIVRLGHPYNQVERQFKKPVVIKTSIGIL